MKNMTNTFIQNNGRMSAALSAVRVNGSSVGAGFVNPIGQRVLRI